MTNKNGPILSADNSRPIFVRRYFVSHERFLLVIEPILVLNLVRAQSSWLGLGTKPPADQSPNRMNALQRTLQAKKRGKISEK